MSLKITKAYSDGSEKDYIEFISDAADIEYVMVTELIRALRSNIANTKIVLFDLKGLQSTTLNYSPTEEFYEDK